MPCGVEAAAFPPGSPEPGRLLAIGRLVEKKAPQLTIRAFAEVAARFPRGASRRRRRRAAAAACEAAIAEAGLGDRVTLHGAQPHAACGALLRRAAVFAQHSVTAADRRHRGLAGGDRRGDGDRAAGGLTRHSGIPEQVEEGVTGFLVAEGDVAGMGEAIARLLADPERAPRAMGAAGRARVPRGLHPGRSRAPAARDPGPAGP